MAVDQSSQPKSPKWGSTTKTVVGLATIAVFLALVIYFRDFIGPLLVTFIMAYLLHPIADWTSRTLHSNWRFAVNLIYSIALLLLIGLLTLSGVGIVQQTQSLINAIDGFIQTIPKLAEDLSKFSFQLGPFQFDFSQLDLQSITDQVLNTVRPIMGQAGTILGKVASGAVVTISWLFFILIISYFLLAESGHIRENLFHLEIPGYQFDIDIMRKKLGRTWDAFLRGQLVISLLTVVTYYLLLTILGTRLSLIIALMAGLSRFVPWIGPAITWTVTAIAAGFQTSNYYSLQPLAYTILVVGLCMILDLIFDQVIVPRMLGKTLRIHPAAVLISALVLSRFIGLVGLMLAAPVIASIMLIGGYISRKMADLPPWPTSQDEDFQTMEMPWAQIGLLLKKFWNLLRGLKF
jgi:predicted PurR-regulated permease PerM